MPVERRSATAARPVKTERTHEENQERAYIAASRRSDRSLEARIESARRASEIHKKRTGRALRVTEQDVMNEEMYEEEEDDLPAQYQRLNAHLHTSSVMFNKKLHDYIATQHGVRNMFMSQYQNAPYQPYGGHFSPGTVTLQQNNNIWLNNTMPSPQQFSPTTTQGFSPAQPYSPTTAQNQAFRAAPYRIPQRPTSQRPHQRALSIQLPPATAFFDPSAPHSSGAATTPQALVDRRLSLPPQAFENSTLITPDGQSQTTFSHSPAAVSPRNTASPASAHMTPHSASGTDTPTSFAYKPSVYPTTPHLMNTTPLAMSLPPESQQLIGSALDPNDPQTAILMSGSDNLPQPFTFDPNYRKANLMLSGVGHVDGSQTLSSGLNIKLEHNSNPTDFLASTTNLDELFNKDSSFLTPGTNDYSALFDYPSNDVGSSQESSGNEQLDGFVNWE